MGSGEELLSLGSVIPDDMFSVITRDQALHLQHRNSEVRNLWCCALEHLTGEFGDNGDLFRRLRAAFLLKCIRSLTSPPRSLEGASPPASPSAGLKELGSPSRSLEPASSSAGPEGLRKRDDVASVCLRLLAVSKAA